MRGARVTARAALVVAVALPMSACATTSPSAGPVSPVTVTVTSHASHPASSAAVGPSSTAALGASFTRMAAATGLRVGAAVTAVGADASGTEKPLVFGDRTPLVAWSTIKVPLAVAAERQNGASGAETAAIVNSDNASAESLWSSLGPVSEASAKVTAVLREAGDSATLVPVQRLRPGFTVFGQTRWSSAAAAGFAAHLPCLPGTDHVLSLMGQVGGNQQWGAQTMRHPRSTAVKGGWGPGEDGDYLVRQVGVITLPTGKQTAVAMTALGGSMAAGTAALNAVGRWLDANIGALPGGSC